jgi:hypothetical protein
MEYKTIKLTITDKDIKEHGSASGMLIDELAFSAGRWTEEDLYENNFDYENSGFDYVLEHFDFEGEFLKTLNKKQAKEYKRDLQKFESDLHDFEHGLKELVYDEELEKKCKALFDELEESKQWFWQNLTKEWLYGDRSEIGVIERIGKYYGAEDTEYNHKTGDSFSFIFDIEDFHEKYCGCGEYVDECKEWKRSDWRGLLVDSINIDIENAKRKSDRENEERKAERERLAEYKAEQKAEKDKELKAKLTKLYAKK